ncbi:MAG: universal stress protein, partial [Bacillota bacterium]
GAKLTLLSVAQVPEFIETVNELDDATETARGFLRAAARRLLARAEAKGVRLETRLEVGHPADRILAFAGQSGADLIVMGRRGLSGVSRWVLGSVSDRVLQHAPCPVLVVR